VYVLSEFNPFRQHEKDMLLLFEASRRLNAYYQSNGHYPQELDDSPRLQYTRTESSFVVRTKAGLTAEGRGGATLYVGDNRRLGSRQ
jgi:hypothetical protein